MNIREIAKLTGVCPATVSRCLNQPNMVSPRTRERILEVVRRMDYVPNPAAQSLSTGMTRTIACVMPSLRNEFFNQLVEGSEKVLAAANYRALIYATHNAPDFYEKVDQRGVDGMILSGADFTETAGDYLQHITVPYVLIENVERLPLYQPISVYTADSDGVQLALRYLYAEGNRRFGIVSGADDALVIRRRLGAVEDFFAAHRDCTCQIERTSYSDLEQSAVATARFLSAPTRPSAIFCFNDMLAVGVLRCLLRGGVRVPEEIEVMGFDDIPLSRYFTPSLSTVSAPNRRLGEKAAELLLASIAGRTVPRTVCYPVSLCLRESTRNCVPQEAFDAETGKLA